MSPSASVSRPSGHGWRTAAYLIAGVALLVNDLPERGLVPIGPTAIMGLIPLLVAAVIVRHRYSWAALAVALIGLACGTVALLPIGMVIFASRVTSRRLWPVAGAVAAMTAAHLFWVARDDLFSTDGGNLFALAALMTLVMVIAPALLGAFVFSNRALATSLAERAELAERERELRARDAVLSDRERIATGVHDSVGRTLTLIALQSGVLEQSSAGEQREDAHQIGERAREALAELRAVIGQLQGGSTTWDQVMHLVAESRAAGAQVEVENRLSDQQLTPDHSQTLQLVHRTVRESLTNAHRHAPGHPIRLVLDGDERSAVVAVHNQVSGPSDPGTRLGLAGLRTAVVDAGGSLVTERAEDSFVVKAQIPWRVA